MIVYENLTSYFRTVENEITQPVRLPDGFDFCQMHRRSQGCAGPRTEIQPEDYNLTVGFRLSVVEELFEWAFLIPMMLIGFNPFQAIVALVLVAQYQHWIHTERVVKLGWLDEVFNTPSVHRVHHGSNAQYLDKNYGGILMIWDKLFGTFAREEDKVIYGLTRNIHTNNPIKVTFIEYGHIWQDVKRAGR